MSFCITSQIASIRGYEEEAKLAFATQLDIEGKTEEAIVTLESINNMAAVWYLAQVSQMLLLISLLISICPLLFFRALKTFFFISIPSQRHSVLFLITSFFQMKLFNYLVCILLNVK